MLASFRSTSANIVFIARRFAPPSVLPPLSSSGAPTRSGAWPVSAQAGWPRSCPPSPSPSYSSSCHQSERWDCPPVRPSCPSSALVFASVSGCPPSPSVRCSRALLLCHPVALEIFIVCCQLLAGAMAQAAFWATFVCVYSQKACTNVAVLT